MFFRKLIYSSTVLFEILRMSVRLIRDSFLKAVAGTVARLRLLDQCVLNAGIYFTMSSNFCQFYVIVKVEKPTPLMTHRGRYCVSFSPSIVTDLHMSTMSRTLFGTHPLKHVF